MKNNSGFSLVALLIALALLVLVGFTGWYVWNNNQEVVLNSYEECAAQDSAVIQESYPEICVYKDKRFANPNQATNSPESTINPDETTNWKSYVDSINGYSFKYPPEFSIYDNESDWNEASGKNKITISIVNINDYKNNASTITLGPEYDQIEDKNSIEQAINNGDSVSIPYVDDSHTSNITLGGFNFIRLFPGAAEGCFCNSISYVTEVGHNFVKFSAHVSSEDGSKVIDFDKRFTENKESLIEEYYGDIEAVLSTLQKT